ncbi:hypothetical protein C8R44DRAFT_626701 [Mycena epipterygia]|nr:hypothetical protein C8R44DRAFT_626701 [Mycena epipterygia]
MICSICYERFTAPVSLPCGHIFCRECIRRNVETVDTCNLQHFCPTCRTGYNIATIDPALVPSYLRAHILPPMRPVFFDDPTPPFPLSSSSSTSALMALSSELGRATAEITALRISSETWRRRAEVHAAANAGLLGFARAAKEHALGMRTERDDALGRCAVLQHKLAELMCVYSILHPRAECLVILIEADFLQAGG